MMSPQTKRRLNRVFFFSLIIGAYLFLSRFGYDSLTLPSGVMTGEPTGEFEEVTFKPRGDEYTVYAFYLSGEPDFPALISVHGYRGSRHDSYHIDRAQALRDLGYTVLSLDLSDHAGDTVGDGRIGMGYSERWDVLGGYDYLLTRGFTPNKIGLVGESLGASTSLLAAAVEPRIRAVWADSGYARATDAIADRGKQSGYPALIVPLIPGGVIWGWLVTGDQLWEAAPVDVGANLAANKQAIYLVHCQNDSTVLSYHGLALYEAYTAAHVDVTFWDVPELEHVAAFVYQREEYLRRLDSFFKEKMA
jgi:uncharacterized protein